MNTITCPINAPPKYPIDMRDVTALRNEIAALRSDHLDLLSKIASLESELREVQAVHAQDNPGRRAADRLTGPAPLGEN